MECLTNQKLYYNQKQNCSKEMNIQDQNLRIKKSSPKKQLQNPFQDDDFLQSSRYIDERHMHVQPKEGHTIYKKDDNRDKDIILYRRHQYEGQDFTQVYDIKTNAKTIRSIGKTKYVLSSFNQMTKLGDNLVNTTSYDPENSYKCSQWRIMNEQTYCNCENSQCKKNYCQCYRAKTKCSENCLCKNCKNGHYAFQPAPEQLNEVSTAKQKGMRKKRKKLNLKVQKSFIYICACKKNESCLKSYCGCHRMGINCSRLCKCLNCKN